MNSSPKSPKIQMNLPENNVRESVFNDSWKEPIEVFIGITLNYIPTGEDIASL